MIQHFVNQLRQYQKIWVLTGAGISHPSGIPTYRNHQGDWLRSDPIQHQDFITKHASRQRYWARSMVGWALVKKAQPNTAHHALRELEIAQRISQLVTQNVDTLHHRAGSKRVIDLHGRIDQVVCMQCGQISQRQDLQVLLESTNPDLAGFAATALPDGDADIDDYDMASVRVPDCRRCGGILKPHVVFFGDSVPKPRVNLCLQQMAESDAVLVIGSSLKVFSGYRFCKAAAEMGLPIYCINLGVTRADHLFKDKLHANVIESLPMICQSL